MGRRHVLEDPSVRLVRADVVEAWARHAYVLQSLPGYTSSVRRAILCRCDDGRAAYVEYWMVGWRLWRTSEWIGPAEELGRPRPVPQGFELTRGLRLYRVRERSMVLSISGVDRIISFTGEDPPKGGPWQRQAASAAVLLTPNVGTVVDWTNTATRRLRPGSTGPQAVAAAAYWREALNVTTDRPS
jgi:hypothetical protein